MESIKKKENIAPKILIGCVTYSGQAHTLELLLNSIKEFMTYTKLCPVKEKQALPEFGFVPEISYFVPEIGLLFVDNSKDGLHMEHLKKKISESGLNKMILAVVHDAPAGKNRIERIISGRNIIRKMFLQKKEYTHLFFIDSDVIAPPRTLSRLLMHDKSIAAGVCLAGQKLKNGKEAVMPIVYVHHSLGHVRQLRISEVFESRLMKAEVTGLGCVLIKRDVLEKISFRNIGISKTGGEDAAFFLDAKNKGFDLYVDTSLKCDHYCYPLEDKRNIYLKFSKYRQNEAVKRQNKPGIGYSLNVTY